MEDEDRQRNINVQDANTADISAVCAPACAEEHVGPNKNPRRASSHRSEGKTRRIILNMEISFIIKSAAL